MSLSAEHLSLLTSGGHWNFSSDDIEQSFVVVYRPDPTWLVILAKLKDGRRFYKTTANPKPYKPKYKLEL